MYICKEHRKEGGNKECHVWLCVKCDSINLIPDINCKKEPDFCFNCDNNKRIEEN